MPKILIIEDDQGMREMLLKLLQKHGYEVVSAINGEEGMSLYRTFQPDLVITDILMPIKGGLRTIMELKQHASDLKIIAMSGGGTLEAEQYLNATKSLNIDCTMKKPFANDALLSNVKKLIG